MTDTSNRRVQLLAVALVVGAAFLCSQLSFRLRADRLDEVIQRDRQFLQGEAEHPEFQNRLLAPAMMVLIERGSGGALEPRQCWKAVRLFSALLAFATLYGCVRRLTGSRPRAMAAVACMAYGYLWTPMTHAWEHSSDFFDIAFMSLMALTAVRGQAWALIVLTVLAAFNRESAAFGGLILLGQVWFRQDLPRRHFAWGVGCVVLAIVAIATIRYAAGGHPTSRQMIGILRVLPEWRSLLVPYGAGTAAVAMFLPIARRSGASPRPWSAAQRGLLAACVAVTAISCVFGIVVELRVLLPTYVLLVFTLFLNPESDQAWLNSWHGKGR